MIEISVEPIGITIRAEDEQTLMASLAKAGIKIEAPCGGKNICGNCRLWVVSGSVPLTPHENLDPEDEKNGLRLACQAVPEGDVTIRLENNFAYDKIFMNQGKILGQNAKSGTKKANPAVKITQQPEGFQLWYDRQAAPVVLENWQPERDACLPLAGQWEFYWGALLSPHDFRSANPPPKTGWFTMPSVWNGTVVNGRELDGHGFATFRLRLRGLAQQERLALLLPYAFSAYRLWVDDRLTASAGRVGASAGRMEPRYRARVAMIDPATDGEVVLTLQISNFLHAKGGMRAPIRMTTADRLPAVKHRAMAKDIMVFGCLLIMSIYHFFLFAFRPKDRFNLYFAVCCLLFGLRAGLTGEVFLADLFETLDWRLSVRMEWLCVYVGAPLCVAFVRSLFPKDCSARVAQGCLALGGVFGVVSLVAPIPVFTGMFAYVTPLIVVMLLFSTGVLIRAAMKRRFGAMVMLVCLIIVMATVANDILYANDLIQTGYAIPYGMLFFVFSQAMILANRSGKAFKGLEAANTAYAQEIRVRKEAEAKVRAYRDKLEDLVRKRTGDLALANEKLQQQLDDRKRAEEEKFRLQERLQRARKMEALGTLAGGVAHDLNNILSGVVGYPDLLLQDMPADSHLRKPLLTIQQSGQKAAVIVQDLLTLARRGVADFKVLDLNSIVNDYLDSPEFEKLIQFHPKVTVSADLASDLKAVKGSVVHLSKTIMNLVSNAAEAMPDGGTIRIRTVNQTVDAATGTYETSREGEYAVLKVEDEGVGISREDMERIFEPFYTKKVMGKSGTGLGMAVVWGTIKDHDGFIDAKSREGMGTTFSVYLPATSERAKKAAETWSLDDHRGQGERILVVDDVAEQREMATAMLIRLGYRAEAVSSGEAAVETVSRQPVDVLLLDMIMDPGIDGLETYRRIAAIHPGQKAVIASGFAATDRVRQLQQLGPIPYLKKPYRLETLAEAVRAALVGN